MDDESCRASFLVVWFDVALVQGERYAYTGSTFRKRQTAVVQAQQEPKTQKEREHQGISVQDAVDASRSLPLRTQRFSVLPLSLPLPPLPLSLPVCLQLCGHLHALTGFAMLLHRVTVTVHMGNNETHVCTLDHFLNATRIDDLYRCASKERKQGAMHGHDPPRQKQHWRA